MKPKAWKKMNLSDRHAPVALHILIEEGKVTARDVARALRRREKLVRDLRNKLAALERGALRGIAREVRPTRGERRALARRKRRRSISAAQRAAWKAQGRYMAAVRRLPRAARARVKKTRERSGVAAAIREARKLVPA